MLDFQQLPRIFHFLFYGNLPHHVIRKCAELTGPILVEIIASMSATATPANAPNREAAVDFPAPMYPMKKTCLAMNLDPEHLCSVQCAFKNISVFHRAYTGGGARKKDVTHFKGHKLRNVGNQLVNVKEH